MLSRLVCVAWASIVVASGAYADPGTALLFRESFDDGGPVGAVGKSGGGISVDIRRQINMERGTFCFFVKPTAPLQRDWDWRLAGVDQQLGLGHYFTVLALGGMRDDFGLIFLDAGRYAPPLIVKPGPESWPVDQWRHLAVVWDRHEGIAVYEDGKPTVSNWGCFHWDWNLLPRSLFLGGRSFAGAFDDIRVYGVPLTPQQVAQLAGGREPTDDPIPVAPDADRRRRELARMGWSGPNLNALAVIEPSRPQRLVFVRPIRGVDCKRSIGDPFDGLSRTTWPHIYYGPDIKGRRLDIFLAGHPRYDRVRAFIQRPFRGRLLAADGEALLARLETEQATIWQRRLPAEQQADRLVLERTRGQLGLLDFYRVDHVPGEPSTQDTFHLQRAAAFPDTELGTALMLQTPLRFRRPVSGSRAAPPAWWLATPAFGGFQAAMPEPAEAHAYDGVRVRLVVNGLKGPTPIRIVVHEPVYSARKWLSGEVVLKPDGTGQQVFVVELSGRPVINLPPMKTTVALGRRKTRQAQQPGVAFGVSVTAADPVTWLMGRDGSAVSFIRTEMHRALPAAADDQVEYMRQGFSTLMEVHQYKDPRIQVPLQWLARFAPQRKEFQQMWRRAGLQATPEGFEPPQSSNVVPPPNPHGAPQWAVWQKAAMEALLQIVHWRFDKQLPTGEFGATWNDDTCQFEHWLGYALCMDSDDGDVAAALRRFWDGLWAYSLDQGVGRYITDNCHLSEEGSSSVGMRLLVDYGDPVAVERAMAAARHLKHWLDQSDKGYLFKAKWAGPYDVWQGGRLGRPHPAQGHDWDLLVPAEYLLWYNRHPQSVEYVKGLFAEAGHDPRTQPPRGFHEFAAAALLDYDRFRQLCTEALASGMRPDRRSPDLTSWLAVAGVTPEVKAARTPKAPPPENPVPNYYWRDAGETFWFNWRMTDDASWLIASAKEVLAYLKDYDWLATEAFPAHDRVIEPHQALFCARMGARPSQRGSAGLMWPLYGISYTRGAREIAALVEDNLHDRLSVRFYAFTDAPHSVEARVWRLFPGTYKVALSEDTDDDGKGEKVLMTEELRLMRGAPLAFTLPARKPVVLSVTPVCAEPPDYALPDPAISLDTVDCVYNRHLVIKVHNLGVKPVEDLLVRVRDAASGQVIMMGEQRIDRIEAPLDFTPRFRVVQLDNIYAISRGVIIELDPEHEIQDLNPYNNRLVLDEEDILGPQAIGAERESRR